METKIYQVKVGTNARRGNFIEHYSLTCKSNMNQSEVHKHYSKTYSGFNINVVEVEDVAELIVAEAIVDSSAEIGALKKELKELKTVKRRLTKTINQRKLSEPSKSLYAKMRLSWLEYIKLKDELSDEVRRELTLKYKEFASQITIENEISGSSDVCEYTVFLDGSLL